MLSVKLKVGHLLKQKTLHAFGGYDELKKSIS